MPIETMTDHTIWLTIAVFLPLVGVLALIFIDRRDEQTIKAVGIATAAATFLASLYVLARFDFDNAQRLQFFADHEWIEFIRANYTIGLDGISLPLFVLSSFITLVVMIYTWDNMPEAGNPKAFVILTLILQVGMAGTFVAQDLILFFVFFEVVLLPMYFMIGVWGGENRMYASLKFFLFTMFGSALMLVAFLALVLPDRRPELLVPLPHRAGRDRSPARRRSGSSPGCSSASPSRCRCSRSTPGCPMPTPRRRRRVR